MVSILPPERGPFDVLGRDIGAALQSVLPQAFQQGYNRQLGLNAIDQLQNALEASGGDINKMFPAIARAYSLNPSLQRSGIAEHYLSRATAAGLPGALNQAAGGGAAGGPLPMGQQTQPIGQQSQPMPNRPEPNQQSYVGAVANEVQQTQPPILPRMEGVEGKKTSADIDSLANRYIGEVRPDLVNPAAQYGAITTFDSELKQDLTPQEEARLRQQIFDQTQNPNIVNPVIDRIREGVKTRYNEALAKYGFDKEKLAQIQTKWNTFTEGTGQRLSPHLSKYDSGPSTGVGFSRTKEVLTNKYNQYAGALPVNLTPEQMHTNAMALLQRDITKLDALAALPTMPPARSQEDVAEYINTNKGAYKDLADQGFTEALREDAILNKDLGNEEFHSLIWGDQTSKPLLNEIHSIKAPQEYDHTGKYPRPIPQYKQRREKYISELGGKLRRLKPQDDLILARAMVLDSGGTIDDFKNALNEAQEKGLKLSEFQSSQLQEIAIPRRPPLWELFRPRKDQGLKFSPLQYLNWEPFINYLRGKK